MSTRYEVVENSIERWSGRRRIVLMTPSDTGTDYNAKMRPGASVFVSEDIEDSDLGDVSGVTKPIA